MKEERKTLKQREHALARAILKAWPEAWFAAWPPVENRFYYDVDLPDRTFASAFALSCLGWMDRQTISLPIVQHHSRR